MIDPQDLKILQNRIKEIESKFSRLNKKYFILIVVLFILFCAFGFLVLHQSRYLVNILTQISKKNEENEIDVNPPKGFPQKAESRNSPRFNAVEGTSFILRDTNGKIRGLFGMEEREEGLIPVLDLMDQKEKLRAALWIDNKGTQFQFLDSTGKPRIVLLNQDNDSRLELYDSEGLLRAALGDLSLPDPSTGEIRKRPISSLILIDKNGNVTGAMPR